MNYKIHIFLNISKYLGFHRKVCTLRNTLADNQESAKWEDDCQWTGRVLLARRKFPQRGIFLLIWRNFSFDKKNSSCLLTIVFSLCRFLIISKRFSKRVDSCGQFEYCRYFYPKIVLSINRIRTASNIPK
jgi:hypothetical protein